ncbi:MAG TPA: YSC84-related protein [Methylomirabilota bacterium]|jgi:lipid-binding SYLF domain-containing protein
MRRWIAAAVIGIGVVVALGSAHLVLAKEATKAEKQAAIRQEAQRTLEKLYKAKPSAKAAIQKAAGYAAFDNFGMNLLLLSTARGKGVAVDNKSKKPTYMKMLSVGAGVGMGAKDFRLVFVFDNPKALEDFINSGWDADAHVDASAKAGQKGGAFDGAISAAPGVWVYQLTEKGLALEATLQGTKYSKADDLN